MRKIIGIFLLSLLLTSCKEKKTEFIQSKTIPYVFLVKNPPKNSNKLPQINFYKYTSNSSYFIDHIPDPGGFSSYDFQSQEKLAVYSISKCKNDTTKLVGQLYFYKDDFFKADTLIYKCK